MTPELTPLEMTLLRHRMGMSRPLLAGILGVNERTLRDWEAGTFTPRPGVFADLAELTARVDAEARATPTTDGAAHFSRKDPLALAVAARLRELAPDIRSDWDAETKGRGGRQTGRTPSMNTTTAAVESRGGS